ncbi:MAG: disulfide bond formation protein B [Robiginitomaculum sp.]|nr:disulfide bond formation protein B [Robiginitomaculum sp.]
MRTIISKLNRHWLVAAGLTSILMLAAAHGFERIGGLAPCELCYRQREMYWLALAVSVVFVGLQYFTKFEKARRIGLLILGLIFVGSMVLAGYHAGVEWKFWAGPTSCSGGVQDLSALTGDLLTALNEPSSGPSCGEIPWAMFGISMAGWNAIISLGLAAISFKLARKK